VQIDFARSGDAEPLAALINRVYADAERGLWREGAARTDEVSVAGLIKAGELAVARPDGAIAGCVRLQVLSPGLGEFGMLVAAPEQRGRGVGRELVAFAEQWARGLELSRMQLELLVPRGWDHPVKEFLRAWYTRIGYRQVRTARLDEAYPELLPLLATPCDFLIFHKDL
jgi:GNAT superfamily N-acetyltransferase